MKQMIEFRVVTDHSWFDFAVPAERYGEQESLCSAEKPLSELLNYVKNSPFFDMDAEVRSEIESLIDEIYLELSKNGRFMIDRDILQYHMFQLGSIKSPVKLLLKKPDNRFILIDEFTIDFIDLDHVVNCINEILSDM